ncbi:hypothetical protein ACHAXM_009142 [Skeletonema potamos]|jgi:hypothetical protein
MGVSSSTNNEKANEEAFVRSLGDRYPLGDAELRKWCWCYNALPHHPSPCSSDNGFLSSLAVCSAIYNKPGPSVSTYDALNERIESSSMVSRAIAIIEENIFPPGLSSRIAGGLGLSLKNNQISPLQSPPIFPKPSSSNEEIFAWEYSYYSIQSIISSESVSYELQDFLEGISSSCGRRGSRSTLSKLFHLASVSNDQGRKSVDASEVIDIAYRLTVATSYLLDHTAKRTPDNNSEDWKSFVPSNDAKGLQSMVGSLLNAAKKLREREGSFGYQNKNVNNKNVNTTVNIEEFLEWAETTVPMMASSLSTFLHVLFNFFCQKNEGNPHRFPPGVAPLLMPALSIDQTDKNPRVPLSSPPSSFFTEANTSFDLFALASTSITLASGRFHRLFSSEADGLSCNRLMNALIGYGGPTVVIIRSKDIKGKCGAGIFGAFTNSPWDRESGEFYGNSDSFLFRLGPEPMGVYRPKGDESNFMFFNPEARSKGYDQLAWGIGFGGTSKEPRLYIDEILDGSTAKDKDLTFENGPLLSNKDESNSYCGFEVEAIEAFGVGSSQVIKDALHARDEHRKEAQKRIRHAMKGAKAAFLEDMQSGLVGAKVFKHRDEMRERDGGCDMDKEG